jgi:prepilin-type N-terminal cleavage/methylation domain-containing protein
MLYFSHMKRAGFTIVELLIVIVVIAILAAISIVAYNGIQQRAMASLLKSDISNATKQMELANAETGSYPTSFPSNFTPSADVTLSLSQVSSGYCVNGEHKRDATIHWRYESANGGLQEGLCSGAVIAGSETGKKPNLLTAPTFSSGWHLNMQNHSGRSITTRAGTSSDPYPTRPVLVVSNSGTASTTWAVLQTYGLNNNAILNGRTYERGYWVRKTGPYTGNMNIFGVMTGSGTNQSFWNGGSSVEPSSSWQRLYGTVPAIANSDNSKVLYQPIPTGAFTTAGWTLEFQGFELREQ